MDQAAEPRSTPEDYTDFYRSVAGQFDEPALTVHFRAEGRHEYTVLAFVPGAQPFDLFDPDRKGRMKLYVRRVFITDEAEVLPRYLRFVRGLVDSADLPLNVSREMIQESPILAAIKKGVTSRVLERTREARREGRRGLRQGLGQLRRGAEGRPLRGFRAPRALLALARFKTTARRRAWRSLKDYVAALKENQTAIYYIAGDDLRAARSLAASRRLSRARHRGAAADRSGRQLLGDLGADFEGKPFKSVTQGAADLALIPLADDEGGRRRRRPSRRSPTSSPSSRRRSATRSSDVRASDRLTDSAVCLVAPEFGPDRQLEKLLAGAGRLKTAAKPILEINPRHEIVAALAALGDADDRSRRMPRICCSTRRACSTASSRTMRRRFPSAWPGFCPAA